MTLDEQAYKQAINGAIKKIGDLTKRLEAYEGQNEIAIIGYDCTFPGGANSPSQYWDLLSNGRDAVRPLNNERFCVDDFYNSEAEHGKMATCYASLLDRDIKEFDNVHFELSEKEAVSTDPQHRLLLEVSYKALQNASIPVSTLRGKRVGVFIGAESFDYANSEFVSGNVEDITPYTLFGVMPTSAAGRISYYYDFRGPAVTCDTACSSSLVALNNAVESLRSRQCDMALVGGVNLILGPEPFVGLSQINSLAQDGKCKTFDKNADGFGRGEGCGVLILKRSQDAKQDGNKIEAIVKGIAVGQDGKSNGFYAPNGLAEQAVIKQAIDNSGLDVNEIDYVETHGTGTVLGDSIEAQALSGAYKQKKNKLMIGSVKTNVGHLEAAAGMASIIKILLAMKNGQIPPSLNCKELNPNINWDKLDVVRSLYDWKPEERMRTAAVSCFGITGTLVHVILQQYEEEKKTTEAYMPNQLVTLSTRRKSALKKSIEDLWKYVENSTEDYRNICYATNLQRSDEDYRYTVVANSKENLLKQLKESLEDEKVYEFHTGRPAKDKFKVAFLFTGQGSIYPEIAKEFYDNSKAYRESFDLCDALFQEEMGYSIKEAVFSQKVDLTLPKYSQPVIFSVEYALTRMWENAGVQADLVIGHSIGEYAAASYAGLLEVKDIVKMIALRSKLMESIEPNGKMVGVLTQEADVLKAIAESGCQNVSIAAINTPNNVTISGLANEVDEVIKCLQKEKKVFVNNLGMIHAFHSVVVKPYAKNFESELSSIPFKKFAKPMISSVTGKLETESLIGTGKYWSDHLCNPVRFAEAIQTAKDKGINLFIEIGGTATLSGISEQCIGREDHIFAPTLRKGIGAYQQFLTSVGELFRNGVNINWNSLYQEYAYDNVALCEYPFIRKMLWRDRVFAVAKTDASEPQGNEMIEEKIVEKKIKISRKKSMVEIKENNVSLVLEDIIGTVHALTGIEKEDIDENRELVSFGFDSLLLASLGKQLESKYGLVASMDKLFTSLNTLERIAEHIVETCDYSAVIPKQEEDVYEEDMDEGDAYEEDVYEEAVYTKQPETVYTQYAEAPVHTAATATVERGRQIVTDDLSRIDFTQQLFESQISFMREQNEIILKLLSKEPVDLNAGMQRAVQAAPAREKVVVEAKKQEEKKLVAKKETPAKENQANVSTVNKNKDYYVPYKKMSLVETEKIEALQMKYLKNIEKKVTALTDKSKQQTQFYREVYASNRNSAGFRPLYKEMLYQIIAQSGHGSHMVDIDGNDFIDITMGFGVNLFGHCPSFVEEALKEEIENGLPVGPMGRLAGVVANQIHELTGVDRVFFCNSGTEADMFAMRVARAITGKKKIVAFTGGFHGTYDGVLGVPSLKNDIDEMTLPMAPGITENAVKDLILLDFNSDSSIEFIREHSDVIAGVMCEPVQSRRPDVWPKEFLQKVRKVTEENNIAFILDEIITGFRVGAGGAREFFDVDADIVTYGKVIGGGMPIGIVSGKAKYLDSIDGGMWRFGDDSVPPCDDRRTFVAGTFCHHPLAMASCHAVLDHIAKNKDEIYPKLNGKTQKFADEMNAFFEAEEVPVKVVNFASLFRFQIAKDKEIFYYGLLEKGVYVWEGRNCFFSTEHSEEDIEKIKEAVKATIIEMKEAGYFGNFNYPSDRDNQKKNMSVIQQRLVSQMLITESDPYDIVSAYHTDDSLDVTKLEAVVKKIIDQHEVLHTALYIEDGEYIQEIKKDYSFHVKQIENNEEEDINALIRASICKFDLNKPPLMEVVLVNSAKHRKVIIFHFHHTVADGISMDLFVREFSALYEGSRPQPLEHQYSEYSQWEEEYSASEQIKKDRDFWVDKLQSTSYSPILPYDQVPAEVEKFESDTILKVVDQELVSKLKKLASSNGCTLFMLLMAIMDVVVHKNNGEEEISLFTPSSSRFDGGFENNIGMFTNSIVINNVVDKSLSFTEFLKNVKQNLIASYEHFNYPYHLLLRELEVGGQDGFKLGFVYENVNGRDAEQLNLKLEAIDYVPDSQYEDITFELLECGGEINAYIRYRKDLYLTATMELIGERMLHVMRSVVEAPDTTIASMNMLLPQEESLILGAFNDTKSPYDTSRTMVDVIEEQSAKNPAKTAIIFEKDQITYQDFNNRANVVAKKLREMGVKPNDFVAVMTRRGIEMNIAVIGVVKAGGAYVNIDPDFPESRIQFMLEDSKPKAIVTYGVEQATGLPEVVVEPVTQAVDKVENLPHVNKPEDILYCMYTSGTTGTPKGIMITHRNVNADILHYVTSFHLDEDTISLQYGNYTFDVFTEETYPSYSVGATLVMISKEMLLNTEVAAKYLNSHKVNLVHTTPLILSEFNKENALQYVKTYDAGGDVLLPEHISNILNTDADVFQDYGPTENTVAATVYQIKKSEEKMDYRTFTGKIPIGHPKLNTQVYIEKDGQLCGIGVAGELLIAGDGLAKGYLNREDLTAEKFVKNPYGEGRVYHSGDLARWLPDGNIEFLGRIDDQVKIRGQRVELREIENNLCKLPEVKEAVVLAKESPAKELEIYAYLVLNTQVTMAEIKNSLREFLPEYMIPTYMMAIDIIPVTRNGKVDKKALPEIESVSEVEYVEPSTESEKIIAELFEQILEIQQVGTKDNFFDLGGHSLRATKFVNKLEKATGKRLSVKDIFKYQTVEQLAAYLDAFKKAENTVETAFAKAEEKKYYPMSSTQKRTYLIWQMDQNGMSYNMPGIYRVTGKLDVDRLKKALEEVVQRHEIYRTRFIMLDGEPVQYIENQVTVAFSVREQQGAVKEEELMAEFVKPFDLEKDQLIRVSIVRCEDCDYMMIDTHHIVSDGLSIQNFTREMCDLYNGKTLEPMQFQYKDYSEWMRSRDLSGQKDFWVSEYSDEIPVLDMPTDFPRGTEQNFVGHTIFGKIDTELAHRIYQLSQKTGATPFMILMSATMILLNRYSRQEEVIVGTPISGRINENTETMMGMFVNTLAIHGRPEKDKKYSDFLQEIKEFSLKAYDNQEYPFEQLVEDIQIQRDMSRNPLFDVMFALQNLERETISFGGAKVEECHYSLGISKFDMTFDITQMDNEEYVISLEYASALFKQETMEQILAHYLSIITQIVKDPEKTIGCVEAITEEEKDLILTKFNDTKVDYPRDRSVKALFDEALQTYADKRALCFEDQWLTYQELDQMSGRVAARLQAMGVGINDRVAVIAKKNLEVVIGICGIIRAGAAYVPIDPSYPEDRIQFILEDSAPKVVLLHENNLEVKGVTLDLKECLQDTKNYVLAPVENQAEDLAYIIYTSGSTGKPKGVMVTSRNIVKLVKNCDYAELNEDTVILQTGQLAFDASTFEIWGAFLNGGQMHLIQEETLLDAEVLKQYICSHDINTMFITVALFNQLLSCDITMFDTLDTVLFGGEAASEKHIQMIKEHNDKLHVKNIYGPTETTTFATVFPINEVLPKTPIGKPITNTGAIIMDGDVMCGIGVPGELCITGDGVAKGYLNREDLTAEKFVKNPFGEGMMYHSGDLVRWLPDGNIEFIGRMDGQVKIHGFRIELSEIENVILKMEGIRECACVVNEYEGDKLLCAYLVADTETPLDELKTKISKELPHYMVPNYMMYIDVLPLNHNGKVDRKKLPAMTYTATRQYVEPTNQREKDLCEVVGEVLGASKVGITDNYFDLGGDSLKAIRIITGLRERGWNLTVQNILLHQVMQDIAKVMKENSGSAEAENDHYVGEMPIGAIQQVFIDEKVVNPDHFNISAIFASKARMSVGVLKNSLETVVQYHDMLRMRCENGVYALDEYQEGMYHFAEYDLRDAEDENAMRKKAMEETQKATSLEKGCNVSLALFRMRDEDEIYLVVHHFVSDAVSLRIIAEDLFISYYMLDLGEVVRLPRKTDSYKSWIETVNAACKEGVFAKDQEIWQEKEDRIQKSLIEGKHGKEADHENLLVEEHLEGLTQYANSKGMKVEDVLIAAFAMAAGKKRKKECISLISEGHGRYEELFYGKQVDRTVGWFTNMYPLAVKVEKNLQTQLAQVQTERDSIQNNGMGYLYYVNEKLAAERNLPQIAFNYFGESGEEFSSIDQIHMITVDGVNDSAKENRFLFHLSINVSKVKQRYEFHIVYDKTVWDETELTAIFEQMAQQIRKEIKAANIEIAPEKDVLKETLAEAKEKIQAYDDAMIQGSEFVDYPLTGIQMISYDMGSRNAMIELKFYDKLDPVKMQKIWNKVVNSYDVLRSSINLVGDRFIRIYQPKEVTLPFVDISMYTADEKTKMVDQMVEVIDCYYLEEVYHLQNLSSKAVLVKLSPTVYKLLFSCTHMIFDRFSADVMKSKIMQLYDAENLEQVELEQYRYEDYFKLYCNEMSLAEEDALIKALDLEHFKQIFDAFYEKNKHRELKTFVYRYEDREKWEKLTDQQTQKIAQALYTKALQYVFKDTEIPVLALHIARKSDQVNLFDYIGEMLDVVPFILPEYDLIEIEDVVQERYDFLQKNTTYFSALMYFNENHKYSRIYQMLNDIYEKMKKFILVYNNTGVLKDANDIVFNSEKYRMEYNVMSVAIYPDGVFINIAEEESKAEELTQYLDKLMADMIDEV